MELRPRRAGSRALLSPAGARAALRRAAPALLLLPVLVLFAPAGAVAASSGPGPRSLDAAPTGFKRSASEVARAAERVPEVEAARRARPDLAPTAATDGPGRWVVRFRAGGRERVQVVVDDRTGAVTETWTGDQIAWKMARGYDGAFGRTFNAPYLLIPLGLLFLAPFVDPRRPMRLLHLDLLVLLAFGISHVFFNRAEIGVSVPLVYPVLLYLLVRMLVAGFRGRPPGGRGPLVPLAPARWLVLGLVFLVVFRVGLNVLDSNVIDVGYSGAIGADRIERGQELYGGKLPDDNENADTYGPATYLAYVPFEQVLPWSGTWDDLPLAHAAAVAFDLLTLAGLLVLGRRLRPGAGGRRLGVVLAFAWAAYPYTLFALSTNTNDALVSLLVVWALVALRSPPARGALIGLAAAAKFAPLALAPLFAIGATETEDGAARRPGPRPLALYGLALAGVLVLVFAPFVPDGGLREIYDRTLGFQADRDSPFSVWGQIAGLDGAQVAVTAAAAALALLVGLVPRVKSPRQVAALGAAVLIALQLGADHWFYLYIVWFAPLVFAALFLEHPDEDRAGGLRLTSREDLASPA